MAENTIKIAGNYLIIEDAKKNTTEFQLKNVFYKTENDSFIIRDTSYRFIIPFDEVELYADVNGNPFEKSKLASFLQANTGSLGMPIQQS
jgi:hypothetical protein